MRTVVSPSEVKEPKKPLFDFLGLLCWLKVIPVSRKEPRFRLLSLPTLLSTLWCWVPLIHFLYTQIMIRKEATGHASSDRYVKTTLDEIILMEFEAGIFLLVLMLPALLGHFYGLSNLARKEATFPWPRRGWLVLLSAFIFIISQAIGLWFDYQLHSARTSTEMLIHLCVFRIVSSIIVALFQCIALLLVSSEQTHFIRTAAHIPIKDNHHKTVSDLLNAYENIEKGVGPFYAMEFCIHTPIILCFAYVGLGKTVNGGAFDGGSIWSIGCIAWSSLAMVQICLMSDDCYEALQGLLPSIR